MQRRHFFHGVIVTLIVTCLMGCSIYNTDEDPIEQEEENPVYDEVEEIDKRTSETIQQIKELEDQLKQQTESSQPTADEVDFISDTPKEQWNTYGNNFGNLLYNYGHEYKVGQITSQGDWVYYYQYGKINKKNVISGEEIYVTSATNAVSLNVIGDYIYYLEEATIVKVRTDGEGKEELITNVASDYFLASDQTIAYVIGRQVSSQSFVYSVEVISIKDNKKYTLDTDATDLPQLICMHDSDIYFCLNYPEYGLIQVYKINCTSGSSYSNEMVFEREYDFQVSAKTQMTCDDHFFVMKVPFIDNVYDFTILKYDMDAKHLTELVEHADSKAVSCASLYGVYDNHFISGVLQALILIDDSELQEIYSHQGFLDVKYNFGTMIVDDEMADEVYLLGDRVYYTSKNDKSNPYGEKTIYSVGVDGTGWEIFSEKE